MIITGYKYLTEQEAIQAVNDCNVYYGIPKPNSETLNWCEYVYTDYDDGFWYIWGNESLIIVLGQPTTFYVPDPIDPKLV